jgi:hypothetical protein
MKICASILMAVCLLPMLPPQGSAQDAQQDLQDASDSSLTEQQWRKRVEDARARSEDFVANARTRMADPVQPDEEDIKAADQRAMNDPSLKPGDIISTSKGFLVFVGREDGERQLSDFRSAAESEIPAAQSPIIRR